MAIKIESVWMSEVTKDSSPRVLFRFPRLWGKTAIIVADFQGVQLTRGAQGLLSKEQATAIREGLNLAWAEHEELKAKAVEKKEKEEAKAHLDHRAALRWDPRDWFLGLRRANLLDFDGQEQLPQLTESTRAKIMGIFLGIIDHFRTLKDEHSAWAEAEVRKLIPQPLYAKGGIVDNKFGGFPKEKKLENDIIHAFTGPAKTFSCADWKVAITMGRDDAVRDLKQQADQMEKKGHYHTGKLLRDSADKMKARLEAGDKTAVDFAYLIGDGVAFIPIEPCRPERYLGSMAPPPRGSITSPAGYSITRDASGWRIVANGRDRHEAIRSLEEAAAQMEKEGFVEEVSKVAVLMTKSAP